MPADSTTTVAISGGGPAGVMLGLLLARAGVEVTVLEKHGDFLRDFRGDTVHPSTLQLLDELGLLRQLDAIPHHDVTTFRIGTSDSTLLEADLTRGSGAAKHRRIAMVPQWDFLTLLTEHARRYPTFRLLMNARTLGPIEEEGAVRGLRYRDSAGEHDLRAVLSVAADGRRSDLRAAAGMVPVELGAPMDVLWLRLPRRPEDGEGVAGYLGQGGMAAMIDRGTYWQIAFVIPKGTRERIRDEGLSSFRARLARLLPFLADRIHEITDWDKVAFLEVGVNRLRRWDRPGLLAIGDAAHTMSPIGGVGINLAVQDAVATANLLVPSLLKAQADPTRFERTLNPALVRRVQKRRALPTVGTQTVQRLVQRMIIGRALAGVATPPLLTFDSGPGRRVMARILTRVMFYGLLPEHVRTPEHPIQVPEPD